jgi:putative transposase
MDYHPLLVENAFYHIYNRGNNKENIFFNTENYRYFLRQYDHYLSDYLETYAYCLLPNHFHLLVRVKDAASLPMPSLSRDARLSKFQKLGKSITSPSDIISEAFRRFFMSYSKAINKQQSRTGSLFQKNFKRKIISSESYLTACLQYIHHNPQAHGITNDFSTYEHSSYGRILIDKPSKPMKNELIEWYGGKESYISNHKKSISVALKNEVMIED